MTLYEIVKALQAAPGNLEKQAILNAHKDNALLKAYMQATYDVSLSYYVTNKAIKDVTAGNMATMDESLVEWMVLMIAKRRYTGNAAITNITQVLASLDTEGQELLRYILDRSIGAKVGDNMVLTTWPGLYFIPPYMRCASMSVKAREAFGNEEYFYVQTKRDGSFAYLQRSFGGSRAVTRQGSFYPAWFSERMLKDVPLNTVLMGELEVYQTSACQDMAYPKLMSRKEGNGVLNSVLQGGEEHEFEGYEFRYVAWDCVDAAEFEAGESNRPLEERWAMLTHIVEEAHAQHCMGQIERSDNERVTSVAQAKAIHTKKTAAGLEGTVWKRAQGVWRNSSSGTMDMVKVKVVFEAEYEIVDSYEGTGKAKGMLGGITVKTKCGKLVNDCGSGFSDQARKDLWATRSILPGCIVTLEANDVMTARGKTTVSLSLPIFIELRFDRKEADTLERVMEQFEAAKNGLNEDK